MSKKQQQANKKKWATTIVVIAVIAAVLTVVKLGPFFQSWLTYRLIDGRLQQLDAAQKQSVQAMFESKPETGFYAGVLAKVEAESRMEAESRAEVEGQIWVWTNLGLKSFTTTAETKLNYYDVCLAYRNNPKQMRVNDEVKTVADDLGQWTELAKAGSFVQLEASSAERESSTSSLPTITSISAYDQPLFIPLDFARICGGE